MNILKRLNNYFKLGEKILWISSIAIITTFFCIFDGEDFFTLFASMFGITAILLNAKGNPIGQMLMVVFAMAYGVISYSYKYYGELITYVCMTLPMAVISLVSWLRNRFDGKKLEVKVNVLTKKEIPYAVLFSTAVTVAFYFILGAFNTPNLWLSTLSVTTSFTAVYFTFRRSSLFAVFYSLNDVVLIVLWILASLDDSAYISVVICFATFLANDIYSYLNWQTIKKRQAKKMQEKELTEGNQNG